MRFILLLALISFGGLIIYSYNLTLKLNKESTRLRVLAKINNELKGKLKAFEKESGSVEVSYIPISSYHGKTINKTELYIAPIINMPKLRDLEKDTNLEILDCCEVYNIIWYEVKVIIPGENNNTKGFIKEKDIKTLQVVENNIYSYKA